MIHGTIFNTDATHPPIRMLGRRLERLQVLAGLESYSFSGRDIDFRTRSRVSADTRLTRFHREHAEAPQLNPIVRFERILHFVENGVDCLFRFSFADPRPLNNLIDEIEFDHWSPPYPF